MKFLIGYICGLATAIWIMRKQLFEICSYPEAEDILNDKDNDHDHR